MATTSDERREVAARLRATKVECDRRGYPWMVEDLLQALGFVTYEDGDEGIFDRLADLIDPTCHKVIPSEIEGYVFCSKCGAEIGEYGVPNYCHNCGARVVSGDDE